MKRILSILMSMALIATLLISMSVTSFAADWSVNEDVTVLPENGNVTVSVTEMTTDEADPIAKSFDCGDWAEFKSYFETELYLYKIRVEVKNLPTYAAKGAMGKYYGSWVQVRTLAIQFDINDMGWQEDAGYVFGKTAECVGDSPFAGVEEEALGTFRIGREENLSGTILQNLAPMNGTIAEYTAGDNHSDYTYEIYVATNTKTFDFNIYKNTYATLTLPDKATAKKPADYSPSTISDGIGETRGLKSGVFSVVDGVLSSGEVETPKHTFTVYKEDGSVLFEEEVEEGAAIEMPTAPAVEGKTFSHWATTKGGSEVEPATTMGTEDLTYYAVYTVNKYTITFVVDGNTTTKEVEHGTIPTYDGTPSKVGYTFTGWDKEFVAATEDTTYTAQFEQNAPTQYEITFVVDGAETKVMTNAGDTPVFPGTPAKDGYNFTGWSPALAPATGAATYTAQFELIPVEPTESVLDITAVDRITGDIFPGSTLPTVDVNVKGGTETIEAARLHRVHTTFDYEAGDNPLVEMGMLFVPKAVADAAGASTAEAIVAAGIAKDANCSNLPAEITGGTTNVVFKAGLVNVPEAYKGITIYAIPYYTLSGGARQYHGVIETTF